MARALFAAVAQSAIAPLDCVDEGDRRYLLVPRDGPVAELSAREREVVRAVAGVNKAIEFDLGVSESVVANSVSARWPSSACARASG